VSEAMLGVRSHVAYPLFKFSNESVTYCGQVHCRFALEATNEHASPARQCDLGLRLLGVDLDMCSPSTSRMGHVQLESTVGAVVSVKRLSQHPSSRVYLL